MRKGKKISGGKYKKQRKKKFYEKARQARIVKLGELKRKKLKMKGGSEKIVLISANIVNIIDNKTKKAK